MIFDQPNNIKNRTSVLSLELLLTVAHCLHCLRLRDSDAVIMISLLKSCC